MKKVMVLLIVAAMIGCSSSKVEEAKKVETPKQSETFAANSKKTGLEVIDNDGLVVNYSKGYEDKAKMQMERLVKIRNYYNDKLDINIDTKIFILDREDKDRIAGEEIPYGMPFVVDSTSEIFLPATEEGVIIDATLKYKNMLPEESKRLFKEAGYTPEEAIKMYPDLIGMHEVGHTVVFNYFKDNSMKYPVWFHELMATYSSYGFMVEKYPGLAKVWIGNSYIRYLDGTKPEYTTFNEFDLYAPEHMSSANYDWYQKQINLIVMDLYKEEGIGFYKRLRDTMTKDSYTSDELITELKKISPVFGKWVESLDSFK